MVSTQSPHPQQSGIAIDTRDIHVTYDDGTEAVSGVSLSVENGEFFGFLGPNGAGKTTTIKTLVTLLYPTQGSVRINGYDTKSESRRVRESIGYMAQETSIDLELTPRENLRTACEMYGVDQEHRDERIEELLELVDLQDVAEERAETFSGGMKKRLDAATVLVHQPPVVFLDEPTTGLDPEARLRVWEYFEKINDRGTTVFLTTQYLEEADQLCDRLAILEDGEIIASETPQTLKAATGMETVRVRLADSQQRERARERLQSTDCGAVEQTADGVAIKTAAAHSLTSEVITALHEADISVETVDIQTPTLDDVFLALTDSDAEIPAEVAR